MKKALIAVALTVACSFRVNAAMETFETRKKSCSFLPVVVSTMPTQLLSASLVSGATTFASLMADRKSLSIQNVDTTAANCVFARVDLSSTSASGDFALTSTLSTTTLNGRMILGAGDAWSENFEAKDSSNRVNVPWAAKCGASGTINIVLKQCN